MSDLSATTEIVRDISVQLVEKIYIMLELQQQICKLFMKVCIRQFRKDYLNFVKKESSEKEGNGKVQEVCRKTGYKCCPPAILPRAISFYLGKHTA